MDPARFEGVHGASATGSPSSGLPASTCPGCGRAVDPLRAGHVAALEDRGFHYFCRAACKDEYLRVRGRRPEEEVETAAPPPVAALSDVIVDRASPLLAAYVPASDEPPPMESNRASEVSERIVRVTPSRALPPLRPKSVAASRARPLDRSSGIVDAVGMGAGVLAPAIGLLGSTADAARPPLVVVAWGMLLLRMQSARRDAADPHPWAVLGPTAGAAIAAVWAHLEGDPRDLSISAFAGLACAVAIAVEALVARARVRLQLARERVEQELDVSARVIHGDEAVPVSAYDVRPGEQVLVDTGEVVPVDAAIAAGEGRVIPWLDAKTEVVKREGDPIVAGARVLSSRLRLTATWSGRERAWVKLLSDTPMRIDLAAPTARLVRHGVERGIPVVAAVVGLATFAGNATPVEVLASMSAAALAFGSKALASFVAIHFARAHIEALASGITYKDARAFERAGSANMAVLSARGTVLLGEPEIVAIEPVGGRAGDAEAMRVLALAAGAETGSSHPFAAAILRAARTRAVGPDHVRNAAVHAGLGVTALASSGERLVVGGRSIMLAEKIGVASADARVSELEAEGRSVLLVALGERVVGLIALQDGLRSGARAAVQRFLDARIEPVLLSGEARETCETLGRALDIEHVRPEVLPADRGTEVRALGEGGSVIAVLGHVPGDDAALGAADVAVAMAAAGSTPGEWAVALASDDVRDAALALSIPHATRNRVRTAIALGVVPGFVGVLAVGFGVAPLAVAPLAAFAGAVAVALHARESQPAPRA
jgi:P-type Cu+ transporter